MSKYVLPLDQLSLADINLVGGKNASLGEMITHLNDAGIKVPGGFATTTNSFALFLEQNNLVQKIKELTEKLDVSDLKQLKAVGAQVRAMVMESELPDVVVEALRLSYDRLCDEVAGEFSVAVRSSATAEDLPDASFAGQQETFLNVRGFDNVLVRIKDVFASLYNDRAISYRSHQGYVDGEVSISAGIQRMVRSDIASSGVMFTLDTESGYRDVVFITSSYGLGELVVQGAVNPDEFYVCKKALGRGDRAILKRGLGSKHLSMKFIDKGSSAVSAEVETVNVTSQKSQIFSLKDEEIEQLAKIGVRIEEHYGRPMDIEWAKDGVDGELYIVQARPETVQSNSSDHAMEKFSLLERSQVLAEGRSIGGKIGAGKVRIIENIDEMERLDEGAVLVTDMTDPDWEPVMKRASAIVTNRGGRTCHAAIIARELGVPAIVGCGDATKTLAEDKAVTVVCSEGDTGKVYEGELKFERTEIRLKEMPSVSTKIMMNVGNPERAFAFANLPNEGVGLARLEFIINQFVGVHPKALLDYKQLEEKLRLEISDKISAYDNPKDFFIKRVAEGVSTIAAPFFPKPVIVRLSDFKSNEYFNLLGGKNYEPVEENPMLGFRGASRYISDDFRPCFELECQAINWVRKEMGLKNVEIMVPFVRTVSEAEEVINLLSENGLVRGSDGLRIIMMCELPSNALLAGEFLKYFDGFSIGSNDMTQLALGLDRDSSLVSNLFDERDEAVKKLLKMAISECRRAGKYVGICGQGPSDHPEFASWLIQQGIESVSLNPDTVVQTWMDLAE